VGYSVIAICAVLFTGLIDVHNSEIALGDFLVFLTRVASSLKIQAKMTTLKWTQLLLKLIGHDEETGMSTGSYD